MCTVDDGDDSEKLLQHEETNFLRAEEQSRSGIFIFQKKNGAIRHKTKFISQGYEMCS